MKEETFDKAKLLSEEIYRLKKLSIVCSKFGSIKISLTNHPDTIEIDNTSKDESYSNSNIKEIESKIVNAMIDAGSKEIDTYLKEKQKEFDKL